MAEGLDVFKARISATDDTSTVLKVIKEHAQALGLELKEVGKHQGELHQPAIWDRMREGAHAAGEAVHHLGERFEHVKGIMEKVGELVPAIAGLGVLGSVGGAVENVYKTTEAYAELAHTAESLGMSADELHHWNGVAKLTDTDADSLAKSMGRLNRVLGDVTHGKNKDAAALFRHLHLDPRSFRNAAEALPALSAAFQHTHDTGLRAKMAFALLGKAGTEMLPLLMMGPEKLTEVGAAVDKAQYKFGASGAAMLAMKDHFAELGMAVGGFTDQLGAGLAPVLDPVIIKMRDWVEVNRDWLASTIVTDVRELRDYIVNTDWSSAEGKFERWAKTAEDLAADIGGVTHAIEILAGVVAARTLVSFVSGSATMFATLTAGWRGVTAAAQAATDAEIAAGSAGGGGAGVAAKFLPAGLAATGATVAVGAAAAYSVYNAYEVNKDPATRAWLRAVEIPNSLKANNQAIRDRYVHASPDWRARFDAEELKHGGHTIRAVDRLDAAANDRPGQYFGGFPSAPTLSGPPLSSGGGGPQRVESHVNTTLTIVGLPPGVTVQAVSKGTATAPRVSLSPNQAFHDMMD